MRLSDSRRCKSIHHFELLASIIRMTSPDDEFYGSRWRCSWSFLHKPKSFQRRDGDHVETRCALPLDPCANAVRHINPRGLTDPRCNGFCLDSMGHEIHFVMPRTNLPSLNTFPALHMYASHYQSRQGCTFCRIQA